MRDNGRLSQAARSGLRPCGQSHLIRVQVQAFNGTRVRVVIALHTARPRQEEASGGPTVFNSLVWPETLAVRCLVEMTALE